MKYKEFCEKANELMLNNLILWKQTHIMFIPITKKNIRDNPIEEETRVRYDIDSLWDEFAYKENKVLFFIEKYISNLLEGLKFCGDLTGKNMWIGINNFLEEATYYFDSFVSSFYTLIEPQQRDELCQYLDYKRVIEFFPSRNTIGLYWQIYMLRNRIIHFTDGRYDNMGKECIRFSDFSSKIKIVYLDDNGEIHANSTLIDINKSIHVKKAIAIAINNRNINPFDILFPYKKPKGYGKKRPFLSVIENDIFFDHISSSIELINKIYTVLNLINKLFLEEFMINDDNKKETLNTKTRIVFNNNPIEYSISDVFYNDKEEMV